MIEKSDEIAEALSGKSPIFLMGNSGVGKSTTLLYLAGEKMKEFTIDGRNHIGPQEVTDQRLKDIKTGPFTFSITKFLKCIKIGDDLFVDTAGFEDSKGCEQDMSNSIVIVRGIRKCKAFTPIIIISSKSMGERCKGLKSLVKLLASMFTDIEKYKSKFSFMFTKFSQKDQNELLANINEIIKESKKNKETPEDPAFISILE